MAKRPKRIKEPSGPQFQVNVRIERPLNVYPSRELVNAAFERWLDGERTPGMEFRVVLWGVREISYIDGSSRGDTLRSVLRRGLQSGELAFRPVGSGK